MIQTPLTLLNLDEVAPGKTKSGKTRLKTKTKTSKAIGEAVKAARNAIIADGGLPDNYIVCKETTDLGRIAREISKHGRFAFDVESSGLDPWTDELYCISIWVNKTGYLINFSHPLLPQFEYNQFRNQLGQFFEDPAIKRRGYNTKFDGHMIEENVKDIRIPGFDWDGFIASWLIDTNEPTRALKPLSEKHLGFLTGGKYNEQFGKQAWITIDPLVASYYAIKDAYLHEELCKYQEKVLKKEPKLLRLMTEIEMPVHNHFYELERDGIDIDVAMLETLAPDISKQIEDIRNQMDALAISAGFQPPDWSSNDSLPEFLFDKLKLTRIRGNSTDKEVLEALEPEHELIPLLKDWRALEKLKSGFIEPLLRLLGPDGRLHPDFLGIGTDTGRGGCKAPNMYQIPSRGIGAIIRNCFPAGDDYYLVSKDFSGQELRIQAALANDRELTKIILEGRDYYSEVTAIAYGGRGEDYSKHSPDPVKADLRNKKGKPAVLMLGFGAQAPKLAKVFGWAVGRAAKFIEDYFRRFFGLKKFNEDQISFAQKHGYVETILGRRKHLKYTDTLERWERAALDRQAMNAPIQGSAADQTKVAMMKCKRFLAKYHPRSKVLFPIHDEIMFLIHKDDLFNSNILAELDYIMVNAIPFSVLHKTSTEIYKQWGIAIDPFEMKDEDKFWLSGPEEATC